MDVIIVQFLSNVTYPACLFKVAASLESPTFVYFESRFALVLYIALHSQVVFAICCEHGY